ncbi:hypothetical protein L211DRAFT_846085 [Terfezia boudieri ATCC MYA-4762]|uniref:Uncharacterized protein n=1 Tax=Terfezia boudieri ATCC MYA-4762 TaxID=1051890 RepID=A0A3N4LYZ4_9PEZI|nr:hypothetical protein L211DRAFT_846085 [Terfezia boudieri ATCC MYA-4762]
MSHVPSDSRAPDFSYFDEFPELLQDYPDLFGLSHEEWSTILDQSILGAPSNTIEATTFEAPSDLTLQEPAPSAQALPGPTNQSPPAPQKGLRRNGYRCDKCLYTHTKCGEVTRHIRKRQDHDARTSSVSWVGDENAKLARGFISGETIMARFQRLTGEYREYRRQAVRVTVELIVPTQGAE